ncbi:MAG: META domain-containing protein [Odoribacter sp.]|nr:META domain-containing protein [Odoribacter sp.]
MRNLVCLALICILGLAACKNTSEEKKMLVAHEWQLKSYSERGVEIKNPQQIVRLTFIDTLTMYGSAGCNRFFGTYSVADNKSITIKPGGMTMMYCMDMEFEDRYIKALEAVKHFSVSNGELHLKNDSIKLSLVYVKTDAENTSSGTPVISRENCNQRTGYMWSDLLNKCVELEKEAVLVKSVDGETRSHSAYLIFSNDSSRAEVYIPGRESITTLERRNLPNGGYAWNLEDDDTMNIRNVDGKWIIEQRQQKIFEQ